MKILLICSVVAFILSFAIVRLEGLRVGSWFARTITIVLVSSGLSSVIAFLWLLF